MLNKLNIFNRPTLAGRIFANVGVTIGGIIFIASIICWIITPFFIREMVDCLGKNIVFTLFIWLVSFFVYIFPTMFGVWLMGLSGMWLENKFPNMCEYCGETVQVCEEDSDSECVGAGRYIEDW